VKKLLFGKLLEKKVCYLKFKRQYVIEGFVVDFYCHKLNLEIKIDGKIHDKQKDYNDTSQMINESVEIYFIRVINEMINHDLNFLLNKIKTYMETPSPMGEGWGEGFIAKYKYVKKIFLTLINNF